MGAPRAVEDLLSSARRSLAVAGAASTPGERYAAAHLAALRAAAAVLAARSKPTQRARVRSVWVLLPKAAAELAEWADFFAAGAHKRAAAEAGLECVTYREADDLVRDADDFIARVSQLLGVSYQASVSLLHVG